MSRLPDPARSRAVIIGVDSYGALPDLPSVVNNVNRLAKVLGDPDLWGLRCPDQCTVLLNPPSPDTVLDAVHDAAAEAEDAFVVYFAGHGLVSPNGELYLALPKSHAQRLYRAVAYEDLRQQLVDACTATSKVVILDCCYSGRALVGHMGAAVEVANHAMVEGTYLMTASAETKLAWAPEGETYTAFTGELLKALEFGIPGASDPLEMEALFWYVRGELEARSWPVPQQRARNAGNAIALVRNRAVAAPSGRPDGHATSLRPEAPLLEQLGGAYDAASSPGGVMDEGVGAAVTDRRPPPRPVDSGPLVVDLLRKESGDRPTGRHTGLSLRHAVDGDSTPGHREPAGEAADPVLGRWKRWCWLTALALLAVAPFGIRYLEDGTGKSGHDPLQGHLAHSSATPTPSPTSAYVRAQGPEFSTDVPTGWQSHARNSSGQYRYTHGAYTLTVVPGRDSTAANSKSLLGYQSDIEPELQIYRDSNWATGSGFREIKVGGHNAAVGNFTWDTKEGKSVYANNTVLLIEGHYHVLLTTGPEGERKEVARVHDEAVKAYRSKTG
ncbi:caspase domain-containing protein [Streptomyces sp. NPDC058683]|uniref:caspase family protein n=1 Tax=Streptomyces sp. NPDC058683 TaxID=3346597 RepID=UPI003646BC74